MNEFVGQGSVSGGLMSRGNSPTASGALGPTPGRWREGMSRDERQGRTIAFSSDAILGQHQADRDALSQQTLHPSKCGNDKCWVQ